MEFELMEFPNKEEKKAILETASDSINSLNNFIDFLSHTPSNLNSDLTNTTVANFKNLSNLLNRTGRARFRRAPLPQPPQNPSPTSTPTPSPSTSTTPPQLQPPQNHSLTLDFTKPNILRSNPKSLDLEFPKEAFSVSSNSSFMSSAITTGDITGDGSVSNGKLGSSLFLNAVSAAKPPLSSTSLKNRCHEHSDNGSGKRSGSNKCHCIKKRYTVLTN